jgi:hypothetical protein
MTRQKKYNLLPMAILLLASGPAAFAKSVDESEQQAEPPVIENTGGYQQPDIQYDLNDLPFPARHMHQLLVEAAKSGNIERLRPYLGSGNDITLLTFGELDGDPIEFLKSLSGDKQGYEILAILQEVLESGYVTLEKDTPNEIHVWPYFYRTNLDTLSPEQRVALYRILTHGDFEEMKNFGAYIFYRVGITSQGRWRFFVAGD